MVQRRPSVSSATTESVDMPLAYISIGSNLNDPVAQVRRGVDALRIFGEVKAVSPFYRTKPWGDVNDQPDFINAVVALDTHRAPRELLASLKAEEKRLGRTPGERWGPRAIDFDILTYGDETVDEYDLRIPHPRMNERAFVLVPLADLDERYVCTRDALGADQLNTIQRV